MARRKYTKVCARTWCGNLFHPWRKDQLHCSRRCSKKGSPRVKAHLLRISKLAAKSAAAKKHAAAMARWEERAKGMTPGQIAQKHYRRGYCAGQAKADRAAFKRGYQQAIKDLRRDAVGGIVIAEAPEIEARL